MASIINASVSSSGIVSTADTSGILQIQSNGVNTNAQAWVNFNGTTSPGTIRSSYNVSSVTKTGTGDYTLNFTNVLSNANYSAVSSCGATPNLTNYGVGAGGPYTSAPTTSAYRMWVGTPSALFDAVYISVAIFSS